MITIIIILQVLSTLSTLFLCVRYVRLRKQKENEYYTDYKHNNLVLRVFKPEFEYQAIGDLSGSKILDRGTLSPFYLWALIDKRDLEKSK